MEALASTDKWLDKVVVSAKRQNSRSIAQQ